MGNSATPENPSSNLALFTTLKRILRPLLRLLIARQVPYPWFMALVKSLYVEIAEAEFGFDQQPPSDSRITFLTGIHRKEVKRLREQHKQPDEPPPKSAHLGLQLVSRWCNTPEFLNDSGHPKALPRLKQKDGSPSFETLVESVSKDIRPRTILDEWLHQGIVECVGDDHIQLRTEAFIPREDVDEKIYFMGESLSSHIGACVHNVEGDSNPMLERFLYYDGLTRQDVAQLENQAKHLAMENLQQVNQAAAKIVNNRKNPPYTAGETFQIHFGVYFYYTPFSRCQSDEQTEPKTKISNQ